MVEMALDFSETLTYLEAKKSSFFFCKQKGKDVIKQIRTMMFMTLFRKLVTYWKPKELDMLYYLTIFLGVYLKINDLKEFKKSLPNDCGDGGWMIFIYIQKCNALNIYKYVRQFTKLLVNPFLWFVLGAPG